MEDQPEIQVEDGEACADGGTFEATSLPPYPRCPYFVPASRAGTAESQSRAATPQQARPYSGPLRPKMLRAGESRQGRRGNGPAAQKGQSGSSRQNSSHGLTAQFSAARTTVPAANPSGSRLFRAIKERSVDVSTASPLAAAKLDSTMETLTAADPHRQDTLLSSRPVSPFATIGNSVRNTSLSPHTPITDAGPGSYNVERKRQRSRGGVISPTSDFYLNRTVPPGPTDYAAQPPQKHRYHATIGNGARVGTFLSSTPGTGNTPKQVIGSLAPIVDDSPSPASYQTAVPSHKQSARIGKAGMAMSREECRQMHAAGDPQTPYMDLKLADLPQEVQEKVVGPPLLFPDRSSTPSKSKRRMRSRVEGEGPTVRVNLRDFRVTRAVNGDPYLPKNSNPFALHL